MKLSLDEGEMARLLRHPALRPIRRGRTRTAQLSSTYFDTPDLRLQREDVALRVRRVGRRFVQTLKGPPEGGTGAGLHARPEFEWVVRGPGVDLAPLSTTPWKKVVTRAAVGGLVPCFTTEFERRTIGLGFPDGTVAELCLDRGVIRATCDGRVRRCAIAEVEMELQHGDPANLFRLAAELASDLPIAVMIDSKAARGYALRRGAQGAAGKPVHAVEVTLSSDATAAEALATIARECLHQIAGNVAGLVTGDDPEWIHQMRVGTRRLRSCLSLMSPFATGEVIDPVIAEVKWLAGVLGKARDWDVFVTETLPPLTAWFAGDSNAAPGMRRLRDRARRRRQAARRDARAAVASRRLQRLLLAAGLVCATPLSDLHGVRPDAASKVLPDSARAFAAQLLVRRHRKFAALAAGLGTAGSQARHEARIAAKRLRYVAEFFAPLYPGKRTRAYLETLAATQETLGQYNDAVTAAAFASELSGAADDAAAGAVRGWVAAQAVALEPRLAKAVRRFCAAKVFWPER